MAANTKTKMVMRVNLMVDVPFEFQLDGTDDAGIDPSRSHAAQFAEENVLGQFLVGVRKSVKGIEIVDTQITQVHEAGSN